MAETGFTCPKCSQKWDSHDRNSVVIEECRGCRGVFLDRGELERLIEAESEYLAKIDPGGADGYQGRHRQGIIQQVFTPDA